MNQQGRTAGKLPLLLLCGAYIVVRRAARLAGCEDGSDIMKERGSCV